MKHGWNTDFQNVNPCSIRVSSVAQIAWISDLPKIASSITLPPCQSWEATAARGAAGRTGCAGPRFAWGWRRFLPPDVRGLPCRHGWGPTPTSRLCRSPPMACPRRIDSVQLASYSPPSRPAATLAAKPVADDGRIACPRSSWPATARCCGLLEPTNDGPWSPDQAVLPWAEFHDNLVTVHNIRNCLLSHGRRLHGAALQQDLRPPQIDLDRFHRRAVRRRSGDRPRDAQLRLRGQGLSGQLGRDSQACRAEV